jgi:protein TonB
MKKHIIDWKDVASSYYEKALSLAILLVLFAFLVSPKFEVKPFKRIIKVTEAIEIPPEIKEKIKPPEETIKTTVEVVVDDELEGDEDDDIEIVDTIEKTSLEMFKEEAPPEFGTIPEFVPYEIAPVPIKKAPLVYPEFAKKSGIEGEVWLDVEVFSNGKVGKIRVIKSLMAGPGGLDEAAVNSVKQWEFSPAKSGGKPVSVRVKFPVRFYLQ